MNDDLFDRRIARTATGLLAEFNLAGVLSAADVHVANRSADLAAEPDHQVRLALALAVRAVRLGSVCVDLETVAAHTIESADLDDTPVGELSWPEVRSWIAAVSASPLVTTELLRIERDGAIYLDRYWREEVSVCEALLQRLESAGQPIDQEWLKSAIDRVFAGQEDSDGEQRAAVATAVRNATTVLTGGPGTGKTTTVARLLAVLSEHHELATGRRPRIAMCAPTAKAAARLEESVAEQALGMTAADRDRVKGLEASTVHRLLGWRPNRTRFRHDRDNRLPHDVIVVDETSMVSLTQMARLLEAVRPETRLVLVGDPDQLSSIEAGAVLADIVRGLRDHPASPVAPLTRVHRYSGAISRLAEALRTGDADAAIAELLAGDPSVVLIDPADASAVQAVEDDIVARAVAMTSAAESGDATAALSVLDSHRLLCAHREGRFGVRGWNFRVERGVAEFTGTAAHYAQWYAGRPVLVTANNQTLGVWNGDVGVTIRRPDGRLEVALAAVDGPRSLATTRLPDTETLHAMTVHKAQGSQADVVTVVMPPGDSALLTRELFYTAVTRAKEQVRIIGTADSIRTAIDRRAMRASGLADRLSSGHSSR